MPAKCAAAVPSAAVRRLASAAWSWTSRSSMIASASAVQPLELPMARVRIDRGQGGDAIGSAGPADLVPELRERAHPRHSGPARDLVPRGRLAVPQRVVDLSGRNEQLAARRADQHGGVGDPRTGQVQEVAVGSVRVGVGGVVARAKPAGEHDRGGAPESRRESVATAREHARVLAR
jgi:hypothetical protein